MIRLMVCAAELVCRVPNVRWPVSAMRNAASIVSRSRISPMSTTSGSWRSTDLSAALKECVSANSSRWLTMQLLWPCRYSTGSSMVTMWPLSSLLILSIIAARVVDLPEPVGPVTRIRPRGLSHRPDTTSGSPRSPKLFTSHGMVRKAAATAPLWLKTLARKRASPLTPKEKSSSRFSSKRCFWLSVRTLYDRALVSGAVRGGNCKGTSLPSTRICGGELVVMCRSVPPCSTRVFRSWCSVTAMLSSSEHRLAHDLFHRREARLDLPQSRATEADHAFFLRLVPELDRRGSRQDHLPHRVGDLHDLVQPDPSLVAGVVARRAPLAFVKLDLLRVLGAVADVDERLLGHGDLLLAVLAQPAHQPLGGDEV